MKIKQISIFFIITILLISLFSIDAFAICGYSSTKTEAESYYEVYNQHLDIKATGPKYPETDAERNTASTYNNTYGYAVTFVRQNGEICNLYLDSIPDDFGIWNTDIVINDGRVVVTGVDGDDQSAWNLIYSKYKGVIIGIAGLGTITCVLAFIIFFMKMGASSGNPSERSKCLTMLLFTGAGAAGLGAVTLVFGFFWNLI